MAGAAPDELDGECEDRAVDWDSPRLLTEFGSMEKLVEWSSPDESSDEEEWETGDSCHLETQSESGDGSKLVSESKEPTGTLNQSSQLFLNKPSITQTRAPTYRQWVVRSPDTHVLPGEGKSKKWEYDMIWNFLHVPKPLRVWESVAWAYFVDIHQEWRLGRAIYRDRVLVVKEGRPTKSHSISIREEGGRRRRLPDPHFYV